MVTFLTLKRKIFCISCMAIWGHISLNESRFPIYIMYENIGAYFIYESRISYNSCMKIWAYTFVKIELLCYCSLKEENPHFTITYSGQYSYNFLLVNHSSPD